MGFGHCAYVSLLESSHVVPLFHLSHERTPWLVIGRPVRDASKQNVTEGVMDASK